MTEPTTGPTAGPERDPDDLFMRGASAIGDLGSPFYDEERQRDVWNEASAVGFQLMLALGLLAAAAMFWIGGEAALPYGLVVCGLVGVASLVTLTYAQRLGVEVEQTQWIRPSRVWPYLVLVLLVVSGMIRATSGRDGFVGGLGWGAAAGGALALGCLAVAHLRRRRTDG